MFYYARKHIERNENQNECFPVVQSQTMLNGTREFYSKIHIHELFQ